MRRRLRLASESVHGQEDVPKLWNDDRSGRRVAVEFGNLVYRECFHEVRLPAQHLRRTGRRVGRNEDDSIELCSAAIVRRVGNELDALTRFPLYKPKSSR